MITHLFQDSEVIGADELAMLQEVFDALCKREGISRNSDAADVIARRVMEHYRSGERDRAKLLEAVDGYGRVVAASQTAPPQECDPVENNCRCAEVRSKKPLGDAHQGAQLECLPCCIGSLT